MHMLMNAKHQQINRCEHGIADLHLAMPTNDENKGKKDFLSSRSESQ